MFFIFQVYSVYLKVDLKPTAADKLNTGTNPMLDKGTYLGLGTSKSYISNTKESKTPSDIMASFSA